MGPAVMPGQDLAETAGPVRDGAAADLAARDRKTGNAHGETAGTGPRGALTLNPVRGMTVRA